MPGKRKRDSQGGGGPAKKGKGDVGGARQGRSSSKSPGSSKGQRQQAPSTSATGPVTFPSSPTWWKENLPKNHGKWSTSTGLVTSAAGSFITTAGLILQRRWMSMQHRSQVLKCVTGYRLYSPQG